MCDEMKEAKSQILPLSFHHTLCTTSFIIFCAKFGTTYNFATNYAKQEVPGLLFECAGEPGSLCEILSGGLRDCFGIGGGIAFAVDRTVTAWCLHQRFGRFL